MNPVVHFEMPYENNARVTAFYAKAFGWQTEALGEKMGNYVLAITSEAGKNAAEGRGAINGGFYQKTADLPMQYPSVVIAVDSIAESMAKVRAAGGTVLGDPMDIPGVGAYVSFVDTEGNRVSMLQAMPRAVDTPRRK